MKNLMNLVICCATAVAAAGCIDFERKSTVAGPSGGGALVGNWASTSAVPSPSSCTDFKWNVSEQTGSSASGTFSATCAGDLKVAGTARGTLSGSQVTWNANGTVSAGSATPCTFSLAGTAALAADSIQVPYTGEVCRVSVNGVETLRRR